jgi:outer membrane immunogenic protein
MPLPAKSMAAPLPPPVTNWTGCYAAGGAGYGMWNQDSYTETFPAPFIPTTANSTSGGRGWFGVAGGGCDYQLNFFGAGLVVGALGDFDFMHIHGDFAPSGTTVVGSENERWAWAAGARVGYLVTPSLLTYFAGGFTQAHFDAVNLTSLTGANSGIQIDAQTFNGFFIGSGAEYAIDLLPGLFWKSEARASYYERKDTGLNCVAAVGACTVVGNNAFGLTESRQPTVYSVRSELVYRFNWSSPVVARY